MKGDRKPRKRELSAAEKEFLEVVREAPSVAELPWMRVELAGEMGAVYVFALAVFRGWVVGGAPIARRMIGQRVRDVWRAYRHRGAVLSRIEPHPSREQGLIAARRSHFG